jgi:cysteine desulfurase/selenocysteine lyase
VAGASVPPLPRDEFAVTRRYVYLNHAAVGVVPQRTVAAVEAFVRDHAEGGVLGILACERSLPDIRARIGALIGARGSEIALTRNTTDGATLLAQGLDWRPGDEILLCDDEFPANVRPWLALRERGVIVRRHAVRLGRLTADRLQRLLSERTRAVALSWVAFSDGHRHDLAELAQVAHARGALLFVDAIQGAGVLDLDARGCGADAIYAGGAKWLMALHGSGFLYLRDELRDRIRVALPGWRSVADIWAFFDERQPWAPDASRFEGGTPGLAAALSLAVSCDLLRASGVAAIERHVTALIARLDDGLRVRGMEILGEEGAPRRSGILTFRPPGRDPVAFGYALQERGFVTTWRPSGVRVSPHGYTTVEEIDRFLEAVDEVMRSDRPVASVHAEGKVQEEKTCSP